MWTCGCVDVCDCKVGKVAAREHARDSHAQEARKLRLRLPCAGIQGLPRGPAGSGRVTRSRRISCINIELQFSYRYLICYDTIMNSNKRYMLCLILLGGGGGVYYQAETGEARATPYQVTTRSIAEREGKEEKER